MQPSWYGNMLDISVPFSFLNASSRAHLDESVISFFFVLFISPSFYFYFELVEWCRVPLFLRFDAR